ncbi:MAG: rod shape-determining protein [Ruminococcus sp.]|nr:rod shape-determining protein [Ruminococcus sp.]
MNIGIDLGTANIIITIENKGIVLNEPSVLAYNLKTEKVIAVGIDAYKMLGRTPEYIRVIRPLADGVISDDRMTKLLIKEFILKVTAKSLFRPKICICIPIGTTEVEKRSIIEAAASAGAKKVYLIAEPIAALMGAGIDIEQANGSIVVDIGGGTADTAVVSLGGIVASDSVKIAGNKITTAIIDYAKEAYGILIGDKTAEEVKKELTNLYRPNEKNLMAVKGRNLVTGLPDTIEFSEKDVYRAIIPCVNAIIESSKSVLEKTPPELASDIYENGLLLTGGGALLGNLDLLMADMLSIKVRQAESPMFCVAKGTMAAFDRAGALLDGFSKV